MALPKPYYEKDGATIYHGESLDILGSIEPSTVDATITDPPYSSGGQYRSDRMQNTVQKYAQTESAHLHQTFSGDNRDQRSYLTWCSLWLARCLRASKNGAPCVLFTDWRQLPVTSDAIQSGGFVWRGLAVWDKTEAVRPTKGRYASQCEYMVWGSAGPMGDGNGVCLPGVYRIRSLTIRDKYHTAGKPVELMGELIKIVKPGGVILDPFAGGGSTALAAVASGYQCIAIEQEEPYCEIAAKRLEAWRDGSSMKDTERGQGSLFKMEDDHHA